MEVTTEERVAKRMDDDELKLTLKTALMFGATARLKLALYTELKRRGYTLEEL